MIFIEEPIVKVESPNGIASVKFTRNALKIFYGDVFVTRVEIPRLNAENLREFIISNRNRGMIEMFRNEAQTNLIAQFAAELSGYQIQIPGGEYSPRWLYSKYVFHWLLEHYEPDHPPDHGVGCYIPDEEDDFSTDPQAATNITYPKRNLFDRAEGQEGEFYFLIWEGKICKLVVTRDLLCGEKPATVGQIPILEIDEEFQIRWLKSERRKAAKELIVNPGNNEALQNLYYLHNLLLPYIYYNEFVGHSYGL